MPIMVVHGKETVHKIGQRILHVTIEVCIVRTSLLTFQSEILEHQLDFLQQQHGEVCHLMLYLHH